MNFSSLDGCALCLRFRVIALTLRPGLHSQPLIYNKKPEATAPGSLYWFESVESPTQCGALFADSKLTDHVSVAFDTGPSQIIEQAPPPANDLQQPPAGAVVFLMRLEMFCKVRNAFAKNGDLNFWRTRI
jgi:hypothetical protein